MAKEKSKSTKSTTNTRRASSRVRVDNDSADKRADSVRDNDGLADDGTRRSDAGQILVLNELARSVHREQFMHKRWGWFIHRLKLGLSLVFQEGDDKPMSAMHEEAVHVAAQYKLAWEKSQK